MSRKSTLAGAATAAGIALLVGPGHAAAQCPEPEINLSPDKGSPSRLLKIRGTGLTPGQPVYLHWWSRELGSYTRTKRVRKRAGDCGDFVINRRPLKTLKTGLWRLQFDNVRTPSRTTSVQLWGEVSVQRKLVAPFPKIFITLRRGT
jgi:hypothetical protein